jgi:heat shock protein HtpX
MAINFIMSSVRVIALFAFLIGLFVIIGWVIGTFMMGEFWYYGILLFIILAVIINGIAYFLSSKIVLWSYKVRIIEEKDNPRLFRIVRRVATNANLPMPKVGIIPTKTPNAFATGRNPKNAVVAATDGILDVLDDRDLEGVMAHEIGHVKNRDILVMSVAATIAGAIAIAVRILWINMLFGGRSRGGGNANWLLLLVVMITAPIAALMVQLAISRSREYKADKAAALLMKRPNSLADALQKLEKANKKRPIEKGNPASASLFIVNPFKGQSIIKLFSTHPPIKERIRRLRKMAKEMYIST